MSCMPSPVYVGINRLNVDIIIAIQMDHINYIIRMTSWIQTTHLTPCFSGGHDWILKKSKNQSSR